MKYRNYNHYRTEKQRIEDQQAEFAADFLTIIIFISFLLHLFM